MSTNHYDGSRLFDGWGSSPQLGAGRDLST